MDESGADTTARRGDSALQDANPDDESLSTGNAIGMAIVGAPAEITDEALAAAARSGDRMAFSTLVGRYRDTAFAYAYVRLGSREECEDVVQEAIVRAFVSLPKFQINRSWGAWLMRIVRNLVFDTLRRRRSHTHPPAFDDLWQDSGPTPETEVIATEDRQDLLRAVAELPEKYRTPLLMHYSAKRTRKEIALALGLPESTVIGRLAGAMRILRKRLRESS